MTETLYAIEIELAPQDSLYYASREAGERFMTKPYLMHTALNYAFDFFPSRFRVAEQRPKYIEHRDRSALGTAGYIHPARLIGPARYQTRRFAAKGDAFRSASERGSGNFKETGHQRYLQPDCTFRTFFTTTDRDLHDYVEAELPSYIRVGKKMTSTQVEYRTHEVPVKDGEFELGQPVSNLDLDMDAYEIVGNIQWERMVPADLLLKATLVGRYGELKTAFDSTEASLALPVDVAFLQQE
jgi:CRISPR type I-D-associated protein Csc1